MTELRTDGADTPSGATLIDIQERLEAHFMALRHRRDALVSGLPIFALEHGLAAPDVVQLKGQICLAVSRRTMSRDSWLPMVVYASEIGYEYSGDEYWQTFESRTPGWVGYGDRDYIRRMFRRFEQQFGGAAPAGRWADQFSIICWPITHAVLPTDLQRHLARLLFDYRSALTSDLLNNPSEFGKRLAARSWQASSRFQIFAQNTDLLGQVAVALLVGDDDESPYLLKSTLQRIAENLSKESEAKHWLREAMSTAIRVQTRGLRSVSQPAAGTKPTQRQRKLPSSTDPATSLRRETRGWTAYLELPDLSALAERLPTIHTELGTRRARLAGAAGPPLARGRLLYPGQRIPLADWPPSTTPLISLENAPETVNSLIAQQCVLSPGPPWIFRLREPEFATEVRGKFARPGHEYVLLVREPLSTELPPWVARTASGTGGVFAYAMSVPSILSDIDLAVLKQMRLGVITDLQVRPAGLVPAVWDGEGTAEWIVGDEPVVGISSTRSASHCLLTLDGDEHLTRWPTSESEIFIRLTSLGVGAHDLGVSVIPIEGDMAGAEGSLAIVIRPPVNRPPSGSRREGFMIVASPASPTLTEIWDGGAVLTILGPAQVPVTLEVALTDRSGKQLARQSLETHLPVDEDAWRDLFASQVRQITDFYARYDEAESCLITVSAPNLGAVSLRADREFAAFRWAAGRDRRGPFVRLIDNTDGQRPPELALFEFARPDIRIALEVGVDVEPIVRREDGGLVTAKVETAQVAVILPPLVRTLGDLGPVHLTAPIRSNSGARSLIGLAALWASASLPADPFGASRQNAVLRAITSTLVGSIGGERWQRIERAVAFNDGAVNALELRDEIGDKPFHRSLAADLLKHVDALSVLRPEKRARPFAAALAAHSYGEWMQAGNTRMAEFLLRLASDPSSLASWPAIELEAKVQSALELPVMLRAARFIVLMTQAPAKYDPSDSHRASAGGLSRRGGWIWD